MLKCLDVGTASRTASFGWPRQPAVGIVCNGTYTTDPHYFRPASRPLGKYSCAMSITTKKCVAVSSHRLGRSVLLRGLLQGVLFNRIHSLSQLPAWFDPPECVML